MIKTPEQVAASQRDCFHIVDGDVEEMSWSYIESIIAESISIDRAQRDNEVTCHHDDDGQMHDAVTDGSSDGHRDLKQTYRDGNFWTLCECGKEFSGMDPDDADANQMVHREIRSVVTP